jgi:hypothetical protein
MMWWDENQLIDQMIKSSDFLFFLEKINQLYYVMIVSSYHLNFYHCISSSIYLSITINRVDFRKIIVRLKKAVNLFSSFVDRHFREFFKNSSNLQFVSLRLILSNKLSQLNLADQILRAQDQQKSQVSSFLSSISSTSLLTDVFTKISEITISADSSIYVEIFRTQQSRSFEYRLIFRSHIRINFFGDTTIRNCEYRNDSSQNNSDAAIHFISH